MHLVAKTYGRRPSEIAGIRDEWAAYQFDVAVALDALSAGDGDSGQAASAAEWMAIAR